ncbi:MAG: pentapeptide repeat-containing protein [Magnetococcales bacterium]|nr:pentapeptide repeat-containing protein [Magnetococcales bacterium]
MPDKKCITPIAPSIILSGRALQAKYEELEQKLCPVDNLDEYCKCWDSSNREKLGVDFSNRKIIAAEHELAGRPLICSGFRGSVFFADPDSKKLDLSRTDFRCADLFWADFRNTNLEHAKLQKATASCANFYGVKLDGADLSHAKLRNADFRRASLKGVNFTGADLGGALFKNSVLTGANFQGATGLQSSHFSWADISGVLNVDIPYWDKKLERVDEMARNARWLFMALLVTWLFIVFATATISDWNLLSSAKITNLPFISADINLRGFVFMAPTVLLSLYLYFHLYLLRLWEGLSFLPKIFPDGRPIVRTVYPWLALAWMQSLTEKIDDEDSFSQQIYNERKPVLNDIQLMIVGLFSWWAPPYTLLILWIRFFPLQNPWITAWLLFSAVAALIIGIIFHYQGDRIICNIVYDGKPQDNIFHGFYQKWRYRVGLLSIFVLVMLYVSVGGVYAVDRHFLNKNINIQESQACKMGGLVSVAGLGENDWYDPRMSIPWILLNIPFLPSYSVFAELDEQSAFHDTEEKLINILDNAHSNKADNPKHADNFHYLARKIVAEINKLRVVESRGMFRRRNFRYAIAPRANFRGANLEGADLRGAFFPSADLRNAILSGSCLAGASLEGAQFQGADLSRVKAILKSGKIRFTSLSDKGSFSTERENCYRNNQSRDDIKNICTDFSYSNLGNANFKSSLLASAVFDHANLDKVNFSYADLTGVYIRNVYKKKVYLYDKMLNVISYALFNHAIMADSVIVARIIKNPSFKNSELERTEFVVDQFIDPDFSGAKMYNTQFLDELSANSKSKLPAVQPSKFSKNNFGTGASRNIFENPIFDGAILRKVNFRHAKFLPIKPPSFNGAVFSDVNFNKKNLSEADFSLATFKENNEFNQTELVNAVLDNIELDSPVDWSNTVFDKTRINIKRFPNDVVSLQKAIGLNCDTTTSMVDTSKIIMNDESKKLIKEKFKCDL